MVGSLMEEEKYKMSPEYLVVTESKKSIKTVGVYVTSTQDPVTKSRII